MQHPLVTASFYMKNIEKLDLFFRKGGAVFSRNTQLQLCNSGYEFRPGRTQGKPAKSNFSAQRQKKKTRQNNPRNAKWGNCRCGNFGIHSPRMVKILLNQSIDWKKPAILHIVAFTKESESHQWGQQLKIIYESCNLDPSRKWKASTLVQTSGHRKSMEKWMDSPVL